MIKGKKIIIAIIGIVFVFIGMFAFLNLNKKVGNIDSVERIIKDENSHKREDIEHTFDMIEEDFNTKDYKDCVLNKITYSGQFLVNGNSLEESYKESNEAEEAIILEVNFTTGKHPAVGLVSDNDYTYKAVFIKKENNWILKEYGQG